MDHHNIKTLKISKLYGFSFIGSRQEELLSVLGGILRDEAGGVGPKLVFTPNPEMVVLSDQDAVFRAALTKADYNIPDGVGLGLLSTLAGAFGLVSSENVLRHRIAGSDLSWELCRLLSEFKGKVFLLGASEFANRTAQARLKRSFPDLKIEGEAGYQDVAVSDEVETERVMRLINKFKPDLLLVAFGQGKQELWLTNNKTKIKAKLAVGVGGTFDYWAGLKSRAPRMVRKAGLEWLWRLAIEPRRIGRIARAVVIFPFVGMRLILQKR